MRRSQSLAVSRASIANTRRIWLLATFLIAAALLRLLGSDASTSSFVVYGLWIGAALLYRALLGRVRLAKAADVLQTIA